jgi:hypothetical protein
MKILDYVCVCNNCGNNLIDTNPQVNAKKFDVSNLLLSELVIIEDMKACPNCLTDSFLMDIEIF